MANITPAKHQNISFLWIYVSSLKHHGYTLLRCAHTEHEAEFSCVKITYKVSANPGMMQCNAIICTSLKCLFFENEFSWPCVTKQNQLWDYPDVPDVLTSWERIRHGGQSICCCLWTRGGVRLDFGWCYEPRHNNIWLSDDSGISTTSTL